MPGATGREVVSGPYNRPEAFQFTQFQRNRIFGKELKTLPYAELRRYLELYNVKHLLVTFPGARLRPLQRDDEVSVHDLRAPGGTRELLLRLRRQG